MFSSQILFFFVCLLICLRFRFAHENFYFMTGSPLLEIQLYINNGMLDYRELGFDLPIVY